MKFETFPKEWGILLTPPESGKDAPVRPGDLRILKRLQKHFQDEFEGEPITYKWQVRPLLQERKWAGTQGVLNRLWEAGIVPRFCTTIHTISGRPNYNSYYIWVPCDVEDEEVEDEQGQVEADNGRCRAPTPVYPL